MMLHKLYFWFERIYRHRKYNTVISIGAACFVPEALKQLKLRDFSGPFDWMYGSDVITRLGYVYNRFENYFNSSDFEYVGENTESLKSVYKNIRTGIVYNHDFESGDFSKVFPQVAEKYARRISRVLKYLDSGRRILFVYSELGDSRDVNQIIDIMKKINNRYTAEIDLLYVCHKPEIPIGKYCGLRRVSKNVIYCEYHYQTYPTETVAARSTLKDILGRVTKRRI